MQWFINCYVSTVRIVYLLELDENSCISIQPMVNPDREDIAIDEPLHCLQWHVLCIFSFSTPKKDYCSNFNTFKLKMYSRIIIATILMFPILTFFILLPGQRTVSERLADSLTVYLTGSARGIKFDVMRWQGEIEKPTKTVSVKGKEVEAVIDSGSDLHLMWSSCYMRLGSPPLRDNSISFGVIGTFESRSLGSFDSDVIIDKMPVQIQINVIPDHAIGHDLLIEGELSDLVEVRLKRRQVTCFQLEDANSQENLEAKYSSTKVLVWKVMNVNIFHEGPKFKALTHHVTHSTIKTKLEELIESYKLNKA